MTRALLLVLSDDRRRQTLAQALGSLGLEILDAPDPAAATRLLTTSSASDLELTAVVAELSARRLALGKLLALAKTRTPRPHCFVLASENAEPAEDAWEATTLSSQLAPESLAAKVQSQLGNTLPTAWRYRTLRRLSHHESWTAHWSLPPSGTVPCILARVSGAQSDDLDLRESFVAATRRAKELRHPGIAPVGESGGEDSLPFLTYPVPRGVTLSELIRTQGPLALELPLVLHVGLALSEALEAVHGAGPEHAISTHGALERRAVWLTHDGTPLLLFTGIAPLGEVGRLGSRSKGGLSRYLEELPPEQIRGVKPDARGDLYRLGMLLYVLVTGQSPFQRKTAEESMAAALNTRPLPPAKRVPELPASLDALIVRLLAKERSERPGSAKEISDVLRPLLESTKPPPSPMIKRLFRSAERAPAVRLSEKVRTALSQLET